MPRANQGATQKSDGCLVFSIGVTGHRDCDPTAMPQVQERLEAELSRLKDLCCPRADLIAVYAVARAGDRPKRND
jgi:hypothetical protein